MSAIAAAPVERGPLFPGLGRMFGWAITSYFGPRIDPMTGRPGNHGGMDLAYAGCSGAAIIAPVSGRLSQGWDHGGGNWSALVGGNGDYWGFGHASRFAWPGGGQRDVRAGDVIAFVGSTGAHTTGPHLHIAFRSKDAPAYEDPFDILTAFGGRGPGFNPQPHERRDEIDMADIEQLRTEFVNQDARTRAFIDGAFAAKDARDRMFMIALVAKATKALGGDEALDRLRGELTRRTR